MCIEYVIFVFPLPLARLPASVLCSTYTVAINVDPLGTFVQHFSTVLRRPFAGLEDLASDDQVYTSIDPSPGAMVFVIRETHRIEPAAA